MADLEILSKRLIEVRKLNGYTRKRLAEELNRPYRTITNYETGEHEPGHKYLIEISKKFGVTVDYLVGRSDTPQPEAKKTPPYSSEAMKLAGDYDKMDRHGREIVRLIADKELERIQTESTEKEKPPEEERVVRFSVPGYSMPMSAGTGEEAGQEYPENYTLVKEPPRGASYIARVSGHSMEPTFNDGDLLFVHACDEIPVGEIGAFFMDGQQWIKELGDGALISHNPEYAPRLMTEDIRCQGLVLGVCDDSYLE